MDNKKKIDALEGQIRKHQTVIKIIIITILILSVTLFSLSLKFSRLVNALEQLIQVLC